MRLKALGWFFMATSAFAGITGPSISYETSSGSPYSQFLGGAPQGTVSHRRVEANLFAPLPWKPLDITFVPRLGLQTEERAPFLPADLGILQTHLTSLELTLAALHNVGESSQVFLTFSRYGSVDFLEPPHSLYESYLGLRTQNWLSGVMGGRDRVLLLLRTRAFPDGPRWLPFLGFKVEYPSGFFWDILIPAHAQFGWTSPEDAWQIKTGFRMRSRDYPWSTSIADGWVEGHVKEFFLGIRRQLYSFVHFELEGGLQSDAWKLVGNPTSDGKQYASSFAPWISVNFVTVFPEEALKN